MSPRAPALPPEQRRAAIVRVAVPLIIRDGLQVTTADIAAAAGIAEGTVFRVFPDKRAVVSAVVDSVCDASKMEDEIEAIDPSLGLHPAVTLAVEAMQRKFVEVWQVLAAVGPAFPAPAPIKYPALTVLLTNFRAEIDGEPDQVAKQIAAVVVALSLPTIYPDAPMSPPAIAQIALGGVARRSTIIKGRRSR
jgi:AcrR family transcriptional regulator